MSSTPWIAALILPLSRGPSAQDSGSSQVVPGEAFERLSPELRQSLSALDPRVDGWGSEALADATGGQLKRLAQALEDPGADVAAVLDAVLSADFVVNGLVPPSRVHANEVFEVRMSRGAAGEPGGRREFWDALCVPLAGASDVHAKFKFIRVEAEGQGPVTEALLGVHARTGGLAVQVNAWWRCTWRGGADGGEPPRLAAVEVRAHEEVRTRQALALFTDATEELFTGVPALAEQLFPGLSEWRGRLDTRLGVPLLGHAAGIALGDVNGDGLEDLYLCQPGGLPNKLFLHRADGGLQDASSAAGVDFLDFSRAALLVDLDQDGDRDLAVHAADRLLFLANDGQARFWLQAAHETSDATSLAAADIDLDGDLDLYVCAYASPYDHSALPVPYHDANNGKPNLLLENQGDWVFVDRTEARGLDQNNRRFSFAAAFEDYDLDGDPDLYVANDFGRNNLYRNDEGKFVDVAAEAGVEDISAGMGVSWGDSNGDGRFDLYVSNMYSSAGNRIAYQRRFQAHAGEAERASYQRHAHGNTLFENLGSGTFVDHTEAENPLGVAMGRWAWGALFTDLDNDGWQDLVSPNGFLTEARTDDL